MRAPLILAAALLLSACGAPRPDVVDTGFAPVTLDDFKAGEVLVLPDAPPDGVFDNLGAHLLACPPGSGDLGRVGSGYRVTDAAGREILLVRIAQVSRSSAVNLTGSALTPALKERLADAALGRSSCA